MDNKFVTVVIVTLIITLSAVFSFKMYLDKNRFEIKTTSKGKVFKTDTKTGDIWEIKYGKEELIKPEEPEEEQSPTVYVDLKPNELRKLEGQALSVYGTEVTLNVYNGNDFSVAEIIFEFENENTIRKISSSHSSQSWIRYNGFRSNKATEFSLETGMNLKDWNWRIHSAKKVESM
jgi:hypothetical protein